jgi:hypothetical protein
VAGAGGELISHFASRKEHKINGKCITKQVAADAFAVEFLEHRKSQD